MLRRLIRLVAWHLNQYHVKAAEDLFDERRHYLMLNDAEGAKAAYRLYRHHFDKSMKWADIYERNRG